MSLEKAIEENNVLKVKELLSKGVRKKEFEVAIQEAASSGQTEILDAFLEAGTSKKMLTLCLGWAVRKNQNHLISALVDAGANVNLSRQFETPLSYAAQAGNTEGAALLLAAGADPNYALEHGEEADKIPLTVAIEKGHTDLV